MSHAEGPHVALLQRAKAYCRTAADLSETLVEQGPPTTPRAYCVPPATIQVHKVVVVVLCLLPLFVHGSLHMLTYDVLTPASDELPVLSRPGI